MTQITRTFYGLLLTVGIAGGSPQLEAQNATSAAKPVPAPVDGPNHPLIDTVLDRLVGTWSVTRRVQGRTTAVVAGAAWVLNHQFLRVHYQMDSSAATPYEAMVFIGYDNASRRYVAHWLDVFGGRWSETLGYGLAVPSGIRFEFAYPDGPFENIFTFDAVAGEWQSVMRQRNTGAAWSLFGDERFRRAPGPADTAPPPRTNAQIVLSVLAPLEKRILDLAEAMPADKYSFAPTAGEFRGVRTFGEQLKHIAADLYLDAGAILREKGRGDVGPGESGSSAVRTKPEIIAYVRDAFAYMRRASAQIDDANVPIAKQEATPYGPTSGARLRTAIADIGHTNDHYGQLVEYLRMNGIVPPASRP